jgi:DNA-binding response OmpR family regulator
VHYIAETCPTCGNETRRIHSATYDHTAHRLTGDGFSFEFTPSEGIIFSLLWRAYPSRRTVTHENIISTLYSDDPSGGPEGARLTVNVIVHNARKRLRDNNANIIIITRWGIGYTMDFINDAYLHAIRHHST